MHNHEPVGYECPFCLVGATGRSALPVEIVPRNEDVILPVNPRWWPRNPGACLVVPLEHHENLYELPDELGTPVQRAARLTAVAMKAALGCDGVSTVQDNGAAWPVS